VRIVSSAPTRIDLAGATVDIWPLYLFHDGAATLNAAISLRAHAQVRSRSDGIVELQSTDTDRRVRAKHWSELDGAGDLALLSLLARHYQLEAATLTTRAESPAGAGIAGSSALTIAVCGVLARFTDSPLDPEQLLQVAMNVECQTIRVPTGVQDYRPALYGGIAAIELRVDGVKRVPIDRSMSTLRSSSGASSSRTPACPGTPGRTTGRLRSATSMAIVRSSIPSSAFGTPRSPCAARSNAAIGMAWAARWRTNGTAASG
jgi:galactokinase/mevalonate kinase-like predicted kinase